MLPTLFPRFASGGRHTPRGKEPGHFEHRRLLHLKRRSTQTLLVHSQHLARVSRILYVRFLLRIRALGNRGQF